MGRQSRKRKSNSTRASNVEPLRESPARHQSTPPAIRRSLRLARANNNRNAVQSSNTDIQVVGTGVGEQNRAGRGPEFADIPTLQSEMALAIRPPSVVAAGLSLSVPLVVTFNTSKLKRAFGAEEDDLDGVSGWWAYLSLMSEDRRQPLAPPDNHLLQGIKGRNVYSMELPEAEDNSGDSRYAYASFPGISVTKPGRYCFKISLIDWNVPVDQQVDEPRVGGQVLKEVFSDIFEVNNGERHVGQDEKVESTIEVLRGMGVDI